MAGVIPAKRKWSSAATIRLVVGEAKAVFHIHEALLFEASSFFKAAFTLEFQESSDRTMTLPEDDESVFGLFVDWLYHQHSFYMGVLPLRDQSHEIKIMFMQRIQLYVLADKYDVPNLKRLVLSQVFFLIKNFGPSTHTIAYAYQHTSQNAGIRKMFADHLACILDPILIHHLDLKQWLRKEPAIAIDVVCSVAKHMLKIKNPFDGEMPKEYLSDKQEGEN